MATKTLPMAASTLPAAKVLPLSPLSIDTLTRDLWGQFDSYAIAQYAPLVKEDCFQPKLYKAPAQAQEVIPAHGYAAYGLGITPGSIIYGFYVPTVTNLVAPPQINTLATLLPPNWVVQIKDESLNRKFWDHPIPVAFLGNFKPTFLGQLPFSFFGEYGYSSSTPNLLCRPYPVVGKGTFYVELWNPGESAQRVELIIGVFENISRGQ